MFHDGEQEKMGGGSLGKGIGLALLCQFAYLSFAYTMPWNDLRMIFYLLFALVQFVYLFPLAMFYHRRSEQLTSSGLMVIAALSLIVTAGWLGYDVMHGVIVLPTIGSHGN